MRELNDPELLNMYLRKYNIEALFDTPDLPFRLYEYERSEMMNLLHPTEQYLKFVVQGSFRSYAVRSDGGFSMGRKQINSFYVLGDLEFCGCKDVNTYHEVVETLRTVELPLLTLREILLNDNRFLRHLIHRIGAKVSARSRVINTNSLVDSLLYYLHNECPGHRITSVEDTAFRLGYSRSQLQRVLKELTEREVIRKEGKGIYQLLL